MRYTVRFVKDDMEFLSTPIYDEVCDLSEIVSEAIINGHVFEIETDNGDSVILTPEVIAGGYFLIEKVEE